MVLMKYLLRLFLICQRFQKGDNLPYLIIGQAKFANALRLVYCSWHFWIFRIPGSNEIDDILESHFNRVQASNLE